MLGKAIIKVEKFDIYNFTRVFVTDGEEDEDQMIRGEKRRKILLKSCVFATVNELLGMLSLLRMSCLK